MFALLVAPGAAYATGTLDQQQTDHTSGVTIDGPPAALSFAQTFTARLSGGLDRVELFLGRFPGDTLPVTVEIRSVSAGGEPTATVLASAAVPASEIPETSAFVAIDFTPPAPVLAGKQYAIVAYTSDPHNYALGASSTDAYAGGQLWQSFRSPPTTWSLWPAAEDAAFRTYVTRPPTALTTSLSGEGRSGEKITVKEGTAATDQATLSGENALKASGTFTYKVYSDSECTKIVKEAGTRNLEGLNESEAETFPAGTYYWQASYSGDENNQASISKCGAEVETVTATTATCGKTTVGKSSDTLLSNLKRVNRCVLPVNACVTELTVYLAPTSTKGQQLIKGIIYADSKGKPGARVGVSQQLTFTSTNPAGWYHLVFSPEVKLRAGTYWIGIITGATSKVAGERYDTMANAEDYNANTYTAGPSNPFGSFKATSEEMSLYATYTAEPT